MTGIGEIRAAAARARGRIRRTPLLRAEALDRIAGRRVWVKAECLQMTGSFKARGGWSAISALEAAARARGVIAFSSGNHAQGIAWAAAAHGVPAVVLMPSDAAPVKIGNTKDYGAEVVLYDRATRDREALGAEIASARGLTLIPPYDHADVIAGQGTVGIEIAEQLADCGVERADVLACCGGGGLAAGVALALEGVAPGLRARTAEPERFDDMARSLAAGERLDNPAATGSVCDAILTPRPGAMTFPILRRLAGPGLVVTDEEALRAVALAFAHLRIVLEPGGAVSLAAALFRRDEIEGADVAVIGSGGNVAPELFAATITRLA